MKDFEFPFAVDKAEDKPSVTLFFAYLSFFLVLVLNIILAFYNLLQALIAAFVLFLISIFFYRARRIDTLKITKGGFEIGDDDDDDDDEDSKPQRRFNRQPVNNDPPPEAS